MNCEKCESVKELCEVQIKVNYYNGEGLARQILKIINDKPNIFENEHYKIKIENDMGDRIMHLGHIYEDERDYSCTFTFKDIELLEKAIARSKEMKK